MNPVLDAVDVDGMLEHVDMNALLERVDMNALLERVDMNALLARVDINALLTRIDVDGIVQRVDIDGLLTRVDIDGLVGRVDVEGLVGRVSIGSVVTDSASQVATSALDMIRQQLAGADVITARVVRKVTPSVAPEPFDPDIEGRPAGAFTRFSAYVIDVAVVTGLFALSVAAGSYLLNLILSKDFEPVNDGGAWWIAGGVLFAGFYLWTSWTLAGRAIGQGLLGLRIRRGGGQRLGPGHALIRVIVFPFSFILGLGLIPILGSKRRRALHDVAADTIVVHDWGGRPARLHRSVTAWFTRH